MVYRLNGLRITRELDNWAPMQTPKNTIVSILRTPTKVPLILGHPNLGCKPGPAAKRVVRFKV